MSSKSSHPPFGEEESPTAKREIPTALKEEAAAPPKGYATTKLDRSAIDALLKKKEAEKETPDVPPVARPPLREPRSVPASGGSAPTVDQSPVVEKSDTIPAKPPEHED